MSMPFVIYTCTACNFRGAEHVVWGRFHYRTSKGEINLERQLGWCDDCGTLAPIEQLPTRERLAANRALIDEYKLRLTELRESEKSGRPLWMRLLGFKRLSPDRLKLREGLREVEENQIELRRRANTLSERRAGPRCLICSSESVRTVPQPSMPSEYESVDLYEVIPVDMQHPGCTGQLMACNSEFRLNMRLLKRIYDPEGRLLDTLDCD
ncbi:hypothetical protein [Nevskia sp.]|uniref:hypothetical protein n=1 Tax=Nevskia sp. TaxID=1929292 RepID=UPI0025ECB285|nr:hypothetical protein [Nevskia sp.]